MFLVSFQSSKLISEIMKTLILFLSLIVLLSCNTIDNTPIDTDTVPVAIIDNLVIADSTQLTSYYLLKDDNYDYYFSPNKHIVKKYVSENVVFQMNLLGAILFILMAIVLYLLATKHSYKRSNRLLTDVNRELFSKYRDIMYRKRPSISLDKCDKYVTKVLTDNELEAKPEVLDKIRRMLKDIDDVNQNFASKLDLEFEDHINDILNSGKDKDKTKDI